jgi:hypothetical protein
MVFGSFWAGGAWGYKFVSFFLAHFSIVTHIDKFFSDIKNIIKQSAANNDIICYTQPRN